MRTKARLKGILGGVLDEERLQHYPLNYNFNDVCSNLRSFNPPKDKIQNAFASLGYQIVQTYYDGDLYKTDAPPEAIYDVFKKWKKEQTPDTYLDNVPQTGPARTCLQKPRTYEADFDFKPPKKGEGEAGTEAGAAASLVGRKRLGKYFVPPEANWGPKPRATGGKKAKTEAEEGAAAE